MRPEVWFHTPSGKRLEAMLTFLGTDDAGVDCWRIEVPTFDATSVEVTTLPPGTAIRLPFVPWDERP